MSIQKFSQTKQELLQNTVNFYNSNNRAVSSNKCQYITKSCNRCAIGREVQLNLATQLEDMDVSSDYSGSSVSNSKIFNILPKRLTNMGQDFLVSIQNLHDAKTCWDENGLSNAGKHQVDAIISAYNLNRISFK